MPTKPQIDSFELLHAATDKVNVIDVPDRRMLAIDGLGRPGGIAFQEAVDALYAGAYSVLFCQRRMLGQAAQRLRVGPLEGLWWTEHETPEDVPGRIEDRNAWHWRLMIEVPGDPDDEAIERALGEAAKAGRRRSAIGRIRVTRFSEGRCAQILHVGAYEDEYSTVHRLRAACEERGLRLIGRHHEIYLGDPRRTSPDRWRTILRHPVEEIDSRVPA
jgi:hypothetical protein